MASLKLIGIFAWRVLVACVVFGVICFGAIGLHFFTNWMTFIGMPVYITYAGNVLAYFLFTADVVCFVVFVIKESVVLIYRIIRE